MEQIIEEWKELRKSLEWTSFGSEILGMNDAKCDWQLPNHRNMPDRVMKDGSGGGGGGKGMVGSKRWIDRWGEGDNVLETEKVRKLGIVTKAKIPKPDKMRKRIRDRYIDR